MEQSVKEQLIKSVDSIKSKIKQLRKEEDQTEFAMSKILKPVADPLRAFVDSNRSSNKINMEKCLSLDKNKIDFSNNLSMSTKCDNLGNSSVNSSEQKDNFFRGVMTMMTLTMILMKEYWKHR